MIWSTREVAELAGTTRRAVRHYHDVDLLHEPTRQANGYRRYDASHLARVLQIRWLGDLGLSLPEIVTVLKADQDPRAVLTKLSAELAETVTRLEAARTEIDRLLASGPPIDLPSSIAAVATGASSTDRTLALVLSRLLEPAAFDAYRELMVPYQDNPVVTAFDELPEDADDDTRESVAVGLVQHLGSLGETHGERLAVIYSGFNRRSVRTRRTVDAVLHDLYNPAQFDVLMRVRRLHRRDLHPPDAQP